MKGTSKLPESKRNPVVKKLFETHTINTVSDIYNAFEKDCGKLSYPDRRLVEIMIGACIEQQYATSKKVAYFLA